MSAEHVWMPRDIPADPLSEDADDFESAPVLPVQRASTPSVGWTVLQELRARRDLV